MHDEPGHGPWQVTTTVPSMYEFTIMHVVVDDHEPEVLTEEVAMKTHKDTTTFYG
jgi:hypothetical protein